MDCQCWKVEALFSQPLPRPRLENSGKVCCEILWASQFLTKSIATSANKSISALKQNQFLGYFVQIYVVENFRSDKAAAALCVGRKIFSCAIFRHPPLAPLRFRACVCVLVKQVNVGVSEAIRSGQQHPLAKANRIFGEILRKINSDRKLWNPQNFNQFFRKIDSTET